MATSHAMFFFMLWLRSIIQTLPRPVLDALTAELEIAGVSSKSEFETIVQRITARVAPAAAAGGVGVATAAAADEAAVACSAESVALPVVAGAGVTAGSVAVLLDDEVAMANVACSCSGNCGQILCRRRRSQKAKPICERVLDASSGRSLCSHCVCETSGCHRPRNAARGNVRFCVACAKTWLGDTRRCRDKTQYMNAHSYWNGKPHKYARSWPIFLQVGAGISFALRRLKCEDVVAWLEFCEARCLGAAGKLMTRKEWLEVVIANMVKWPHP